MPLTPRAIFQCTRNGEDIRVFGSVNDICNALHISSKDKIYKAIKYGLVAYGYRWRYEDELLVDPSHYDMRLKPIIAYKDDASISYPSISKASLELDISISLIQQAIITGGKAKGYRFALQGEASKEPARRRITRKAVVALDEEGNIIKEWDNVKSASKDLSVSPSFLYWCLSPKRNVKCKGYKLRYKESLL